MKKKRWEESEKRREEEDQRRERVRIKKMQVREKVGKSRNTVFFQCFVAPDGRKVGSLKRRVRSQMLHAVVARSTCRSQNAQRTSCSEHFWKLKKCTPLWRKAHFKVKSVKKRSWKLSCWKKLQRKAHFVVKIASVSKHFWQLRCRKNSRCCGV